MIILKIGSLVTITKPPKKSYLNIREREREKERVDNLLNQKLRAKTGWFLFSQYDEQYILINHDICMTFMAKVSLQRHSKKT